uniref:Transmembrane protein n=1 Tax=Amphora coffeiformis TaxID=265554 RepID=A0A7S3LFY0_9STRA|mmetsp:Transcript_21094/g.40079  ORF Transcript_21094/g.40079 Transcript_21094/m.40079 type:complete len:506 (+) Transcript_21094:156-1673(+)
MIEPEGEHADDVHSPPVDMIENEDAEAGVSVCSDNASFSLLTTSRVDVLESEKSFETGVAPRERSIFLCDTPSESDDNSSLSSNSLPDLRKSYAFMDSTSTEDDEEDNFDSERFVPSEAAAPVTMIRTIKFQKRTQQAERKVPAFPRYSLSLGFLVGCFIQSSSLGANYVLTILFGHDFEQLREHHSKIMMFSLIWSLATSTMGVLVVLFLRSLLQVIPGGSKSSTLDLWHVEYSFAFGALAGVCMAWCGTDVLLGFRAHAFHSLMTLIFAVLAKSAMSFAAPDAYSSERMILCEDDSSTLGSYIPLVDRVAPSWRSLTPHFKFHGTVLGVLIGFFIQMSSLGASFLLDTYANQEGRRVELTSDGLLAFSLGWSFGFGTMGVMILLILRSLLMQVCANYSNIFSQKLGLMLEFYFAVGCLVGVNLAWVLTDLGLGLQSHVLRSILTLGAAAIWCRVLSCCFFSSHTLELGYDEDEDDDAQDWGEREFSIDTRPVPVEVYEAVLLV